MTQDHHRTKKFIGFFNRLEELPELPWPIKTFMSHFVVFRATSTAFRAGMDVTDLLEAALLLLAHHYRKRGKLTAEARRRLKECDRVTVSGFNDLYKQIEFDEWGKRPKFAELTRWGINALDGPLPNLIWTHLPIPHFMQVGIFCGMECAHIERWLFFVFARREHRQGRLGHKAWALLNEYDTAFDRLYEQLAKDFLNVRAKAHSP